MHPVSFSAAPQPHQPPAKQASLPFVSRVNTPPQDITPGQDDVSYLGGLAKVSKRVWDYLLRRLHIERTPVPSLKSPLIQKDQSANPHYEAANHAQHYNREGRTLPIIMHEHAHGVVGTALLRYSRQDPKGYSRDLAHSVVSNPWQHLVLTDPIDLIDMAHLTRRIPSITPFIEAYQGPEARNPINGLSSTDRKCLGAAARLFARELRAKRHGKRFRTTRAIRRAARRLKPSPELVANNKPNVLRPSPETVHSGRIRYFLTYLRSIHTSNTLADDHFLQPAIQGPLSAREHRLVRSQARQLSLSQLGMLEDAQKDLKNPVTAFFYTLSPNEVQANLREYALAILLHKQELQRMAESDDPARAATGQRIIKTLQERPFPSRAIEEQPTAWINGLLKPLERETANETPHLRGLLQASASFNLARKLRRLNTAVVEHTKKPTDQSSRRVRRCVQNAEKFVGRVKAQQGIVFHLAKAALKTVRDTLLSRR
jgi:hypothetical protein